ncbi:MAG: hypothetical protein M1836_002113 [Candelina mexicana]|nr:MAG: hypothetical protein M1836_002113 [Candelina mexicana]
MSSKLRLSSSLSAEATQTIYPKPISSPPLKKQKMSVTQTYYLAHTARGKLSQEASRADHDLRLLVGHANLLDSLMLELADAEQEQERWFNQSVKGAAKSSEEPKHIEWADTIVEDPAEDWDVEDAESSDSESDSDSESEENENEDEDEDEDFDMASAIPLRKITSPSPRVTVTSIEVDDDDEYEDEEEDYNDLALTRTSSFSPPELSHDSDDSEDESMPPSPPQPSLQYSEKQKQQIATSFYEHTQASQAPLSLTSSESASFFEEGYFLPQRTSNTMVSAC